MTDILDRAAAIVEQATPGPWEVAFDPLSADPMVISSAKVVCDVRAYDIQSGRLIALAPSLGAALALAKAVESLIAALERESASEDTDYVGDSGRAAEDALADFKASLAESIKED